MFSFLSYEASRLNVSKTTLDPRIQATPGELTRTMCSSRFWNDQRVRGGFEDSPELAEPWYRESTDD